MMLMAQLLEVLEQITLNRNKNVRNNKKLYYLFLFDCINTKKYIMDLVIFRLK